MPGYPSWSFPTTTAGIVLTRSTDESAQPASRSVGNLVTPKVSAHNGNYFRRTRAPYDYVVKKSVKAEVFSLDNLKKDLKK